MSRSAGMQELTVMPVSEVAESVTANDERNARDRSAETETGCNVRGHSKIAESFEELPGNVHTYVALARTPRASIERRSLVIPENDVRSEKERSVAIGARGSSVNCPGREKRAASIGFIARAKSRNDRWPEPLSITFPNEFNLGGRHYPPAHSPRHVGDTSVPVSSTRRKRIDRAFPALVANGIRAAASAPA